MDLDLCRVRMIQYRMEADGVTPEAASIHGFQFHSSIGGYDAVMLYAYIGSIRGVVRTTHPATEDDRAGATDTFVHTCETIHYTRNEFGTLTAARLSWPDGHREDVNDPAQVVQIYQAPMHGGFIRNHLTPESSAKARYDLLHSARTS